MARGLSRDTFNAPTLERPTLTKGSLTKRRFEKGGEVKKSEGEGSPQEEKSAGMELQAFKRTLPGSPEVENLQSETLQAINRMDDATIIATADRLTGRTFTSPVMARVALEKMFGNSAVSLGVSGQGDVLPERVSGYTAGFSTPMFGGRVRGDVDVPRGPGSPMFRLGYQREFKDGGEVKKSVKESEKETPSVFQVSDYATEASRRMFPSQLGQDDQRDAARHMLAAASLARRYGPKAAELLGKAHEYTSNPNTFFSVLGIGEPREDLPYDLHNNRVGIDLGSRATSQADLERLVAETAKQATFQQTQGKPWIMSPEQIKARRDAALKKQADLQKTPEGYKKGGAVRTSTAKGQLAKLKAA
jgi:hypothetical protein